MMNIETYEKAIEIIERDGLDQVRYFSLEVLKLKPKNEDWTVAHEAVKRGYKFPENCLDILSISLENGWSVAHEMVEQGYRFSENNLNVLCLSMVTGWTIAHAMASRGYCFPENRYDILSIADKEAWTVAHTMAACGYRFSNKAILALADKDGRTVAHIMTEFSEADTDILSLADKDRWTVAHEMASHGYKFSPNRKDIITLKTHDGWSVAHEMVMNVYNFPISMTDILEMRDKKGNSVLYYMIKYNNFQVPEDRIDLLKIRNESGKTIAHILAEKGYIFTDEEVLEFEDNFGNTVASVILDNISKKFSKNIAKFKEEFETKLNKNFEYFDKSCNYIDYLEKIKNGFRKFKPTKPKKKRPSRKISIRKLVSMSAEEFSKFVEKQDDFIEVLRKSSKRTLGILKKYILKHEKELEHLLLKKVEDTYFACVLAELGFPFKSRNLWILRDRHGKTVIGHMIDNGLVDYIDLDDHSCLIMPATKNYSIIEYLVLKKKLKLK